MMIDLGCCIENNICEIICFVVGLRGIVFIDWELDVLVVYG